MLDLHLDYFLCLRKVALLRRGLQGSMGLNRIGRIRHNNFPVPAHIDERYRTLHHSVDSKRSSGRLPARLRAYRSSCENSSTKN